MKFFAESFLVCVVTLVASVGLAQESGSSIRVAPAPSQYAYCQIRPHIEYGGDRQTYPTPTPEGYIVVTPLYARLDLATMELTVRIQAQESGKIYFRTYMLNKSDENTIIVPGLSGKIAGYDEDTDTFIRLEVKASGALEGDLIFEEDFPFSVTCSLK